MKRIANMSEAEKHALIHDLEIRHRAAIQGAVDIAKEINRLTRLQLAKEKEAHDAESALIELRNA